MTSNLFHDGTCDVCRRERKVGVCSSPFGPMSFAYCQECLAKPAEIATIFAYLYDDVAGGDPSKLDKSIKNWYTWIDGRYVHWDNYVYRRQHEQPAA
jgi:hypothetical protein